MEDIAELGEHLSVTGATVIDDDHHLITHLDLSHPVTVLYGINGAGKTATLDRLSKVLRGHAHNSAVFEGVYLTLTVPYESICSASSDSERARSEARGGRLPPRPDQLAQHFTNKFPLLAAEYGERRIVEEVLASSALLLEENQFRWAYVDECAPTLRGLRQQVDDTLQHWPGDEEGAIRYLVELMQYEQARPGDERLRELLTFVAPSYGAFGDTWRGVDPDWLPRRIQWFQPFCGRDGRVRVTTLASDDSMTAQVDDTQRLVLRAANMKPNEHSDFPSVAAQLTDVTKDLNRQATEVARAYFRDAPELRLRVLSPSAWALGEVVRWEGLSRLPGAWLPLTALSSAERRAAEFGITAALGDLVLSEAFIDAGDEDDEDDDRAGRMWRGVQRAARRSRRNDYIELGHVALVDEPERGLHSLAQRELAMGIGALADRVVVGTHSVAFLDAHTSLHHVQRDEQGVRTHRLTSVARRGLEDGVAAALGMTLNEVLQLLRVLVLVEGAHDELVFDGLFADRLKAARARIMQLGGTVDLAHIAEARWLFDLTSAQIVVVLDDTNAQMLEASVRRLHEAQRANVDPARILNRLRAQLRSSGTDKRIIAFIEAAVDSKRLHRVQVSGLRKKDILEYLPAPLFFGEGASWASLRREFVAEGGNHASGRDYKNWLLKARGGDVHQSGIRAVVARVAEDPTLMEPDAYAELCAVVDFVEAAGFGV